MKKQYQIVPIGIVKKTEEATWIEIYEEYKEGLLNLEGFSHLVTLWWIHKRDNQKDRAILQVHPRVKGSQKDTPLSGVFTTRSPVRPNPIGLTIVKILSINKRKIFIDYTDAIDGSPIIDLKPYIPNSDCILNTSVPEHMEPIAEPRKE
ncbi:MAG: tRNA (N6-threonylcarbamoyladenosine(37)-N6)-methyltransferase TrmO [Candidatus Heimdallarchaeota archaeon]|nr:tRNA (N6-threonylcarbamoyladenosine(37)-N6)-methyltransferase TrmO [Candidatus Heimdallarchaeota archaeon]